MLTVYGYFYLGNPRWYEETQLFYFSKTLSCFGALLCFYSKTQYVWANAKGLLGELFPILVFIYIPCLEFLV